MESKKEECRESRGLFWVEDFWRDLRYGLRMLRKDPVFSTTAIVTLALCIGANAAVFSIVDAVLLRPLPFPGLDRLAQVVRYYRGRGQEETGNGQTGRAWQVLRDEANLLDLAVFSGGAKGVNLSAQGRVEYVRQQRVSAGFFRVLGVHPAIGREFSADEDHVGGPVVALLSDSLWKRVFQRDSNVLGRSILVRGEPVTVVGILPPGFQFDSPADLWTPLRPTSTGEGEGYNYEIIARVRPGVPWAEADAQLQTLSPQVLQENEKPAADVVTRIQLMPLQSGQTSELRKPLLIMQTAVALVLLIGCVNLAGLLLARGAARGHEIATRLALGSGRGAVARQMLTESLLLAILGGAAGIGLGSLTLQWLARAAQESLDFNRAISLDSRVLAVTAGITLLTTVFFGLLPAWEAGRVNIHTALVDAGTRGIAGARKHWPRRFLVITEVALGLVLLVGAGLLIRTFAHLHNLQPGFDPHDLLTAQLSMQDARYQDSHSINRLYDESLARIREIPGVGSVAIALTLPFERALNTGIRRLDGPQKDAEPRITNMTYVTTDYFQTLRIPLRGGRYFRAADSAESAPVAIVNQAFVRKYLSQQEPVGSHLAEGKTAHEIVGVVGDIQEKAGWGGFGPLSPIPAVYIPASQFLKGGRSMVHVWFSPSWIVRASGSKENLIPAMQQAIQSVDPQLPFAGFRAMEEIRSESIAEQRFQAVLLGSLAGLALILAAVGIYGLISHSVVERRRELGIRLALGATVSRAIRDAAMPGIILASVGVSLGTVGAYFGVAVLKSLIWGVSPTDPSTFAGVALGLLFVATIASVLPALRVARIDPAETLRAE
ncbi:MAG: ABC transporter permease [Acidobacteria bacterium]|nr:ABC transporter permease [Acidobacteriota bacterium]